MAENYLLREKIKEYCTNIDSTDRDAEYYLVDGSQNVLIDPRFGKVASRGGYSRLGAANTALTPIRQEKVWHNSKGDEIPLRWYDDELEAYLGTVDGVVVDAWTRIANSLSTTAIPRATLWWDTAEDLDLLLFVQGDDNIYEWGGGITTLVSATSNTLTKNGTDTWAEARFLTAGTRKVLINGTEYTYTGGESTTTLTGVTPDPSAEAADSVVSQTVITTTDTPAANRNNHYIFEHENQIYVGSNDHNEIFISKNDAYNTYTFLTPRLSGEGGLLVLDGPCRGFSAISKIPVIFSGEDDIYTVEFEQITVSTTLAETIKIKKLKSGSKQGAYNQESITPIGDAIIYLSNEPALRMLETVDQADQPQLKALSNPIKPDFDAETWTNAFGIWHKNRYYLSAPASSKLYIVDFTETADGKINRFWQPPQILPVRCLSVRSGALYGHSNAVPETYLLFNGTADGVYDGMEVEDKLPIEAIAKLAYRSFGKKANLKNHDEFYVEGNISAATQGLTLTLRYDFGGFTQEIEKAIDGTDETILYQSLEETSLGQQPLGTQPLGGSIQEAPELSRFRVVFDYPKEDFHELQEIYKSNDVGQSWEIISAGGNTKISPRKNTINRL